MKFEQLLHGIISELALLSTEAAVMLGAVSLLILGIFTNKSYLIKGFYAAVIAIALFFNLQVMKGGLFLSDSLYTDGEITGFTSLFLLVGLCVLVFKRKQHTTEFYFLVLAMLVGAIFMMKANSLLMIYMAVELVSFVSYVLTGFSFKMAGFEASIKYLIFGAVSSAIMLTGLAFIYGLGGTFFFSEWPADHNGELLLEVGVLFVLFGLFFKGAIFPFHIWTPATYQEAPIDAVVVFSIVPKIGSIVLVKRVMHSISWSHDHWVFTTVIFLAICTIIVGALGGLKQSNTRRMISFGSIAHSGFMLGFVIIPAESYNGESFWWYTFVYSVMSFGAFFLVDRYEARSIFSNKGYVASKKEILIGVMFTLILVSLVGLPPLAGFTAKLFLFSALWSSYLASASTPLMLFLIAAILATVVSLFFYMQVPKNIFLSPSEKKSELDQVVNFSVRDKIVAIIFGFLLLLFFFMPKLVVNMQRILSNVHE